jgi:amino acid transporter
MVGAGIAAQLGAARLLLAMGQDNALPRRFFGVIHPNRQIPRNNVLLIGAIGMVGALSFSFQLGTELLNFGALIAFMGVNLAALVRNWRSRTGMRLFPMLIAIVGFLTCLFIWANLSVLAQIAGTLWALVGLSVWFLRQRKIPLFDSSDLSS